MKRFRIYQDSLGTSKAVKLGFSYTGFFFHFMWAWVWELWAIGFLTLAILILLEDFLSDNKDIETMLQFSWFLLGAIFGMNGNQWVERNLISRGFKLVDTISAKDHEKALEIFFEKEQT